MLHDHEQEIQAWKQAAADEFQRRTGMVELVAAEHAEAAWTVALDTHDGDVDAAVLSDPLEAVEVELSYWND